MVRSGEFLCVVKDGRYVQAISFFLPEREDEMSIVLGISLSIRPFL